MLSSEQSKAAAPRYTVARADLVHGMAGKDPLQTVEGGEVNGAPVTALGVFFETRLGNDELGTV
jgi:hypothetical protein